MNDTVLIVDDDKGLRESLSAFLKKNSLKVYLASCAKKGLEIVKTKDIDLVLLDIRMPEINGLEALQMIKEINSTLNVIIITGYGSINTAVKAMKNGAFDYITKPFDLDDLIEKIKRALRMKYLIIKNESQTSTAESKSNKSFNSIIGKSDSMQKIFQKIKKIAPKNVTILILGESGVGKEIIAKAIHNHSDRSENSFIKINCASLPESLLESELFGFEKGAFTGANRQKKGMFELADGGTLLLDEIGDMSIGTQAKILRVLQEHEFRRLGGENSIKVNVRILAATNINLKEAISAGEFRKDLYYRLNVINIEVPPLKERREDIPLLSNDFVNKFSEKHNKKISGLTPEAMRLLMCYEWSGNVRELKNVLEQAVVLSENEAITTFDLPVEIRGKNLELDQSDNQGLKDITKSLTSKIEKKIILDTLEKNNWNRKKTAQKLEITPRTLYNKIKEYNIDK